MKQKKRKNLEQRKIVFLVFLSPYEISQSECPHGKETEINKDEEKEKK